MFMAFEEAAEELAANVRSLGFDLDTLVAQKKLAVDYVYIERSEIDETGEYDLEGCLCDWIRNRCARRTSDCVGHRRGTVERTIEHGSVAGRLVASFAGSRRRVSRSSSRGNVATARSRGKDWKNTSRTA